MQRIHPGSTNQSVLFHLESAGLTISGFKLGYIRWDERDGTNFTEVVSGALVALASITTAHADNKAIYLDTLASGGNQFVIRVDFPDAAFAAGKDRVICNVYDDGNNIIAQKEINLEPDLSGYVDGFVYYEGGGGNTGIIKGLDGTTRNPVNNLSDAKTLADTVNKAIKIRGNLAIPSAITDYHFSAWRADAKITGSSSIDLTNCIIDNIEVTGVMKCDNATQFNDCKITDISGADGLQGKLRNCGLEGNLVFDSDSASETFITDCYQADPEGNEPEFDWVDLNNQAQVVLNNYTGELHLKNLIHASAKIWIHADGKVDIAVNASCTGGNIEAKGSGIIRFPGGTGKGVTMGLAHWQQLEPQPNMGRATAGAGSTITLDAQTRIATNDIYNGDFIFIWKGLGAGQVRRITDYDSGGLATVHKAWTVNPDNTSEYVIMSNINTAGDGWDELKTAHTIANSFGKIVQDVETDVTAILADTNELQTDWKNGGRLDLLIDAIKVQTDLRPDGYKKNTAVTNFEFLMLDGVDHVTPKTGLSPVTPEFALDGATVFSAISGSVTETANGWYKVALLASEMNGDAVKLRFSAAGADDVNIQIKTDT